MDKGRSSRPAEIPAPPRDASRSFMSDSISTRDTKSETHAAAAHAPAAASRSASRSPARETRSDDLAASASSATRIVSRRAASASSAARAVAASARASFARASRISACRGRISPKEMLRGPCPVHADMFGTAPARLEGVWCPAPVPGVARVDRVAAPERGGRRVVSCARPLGDHGVEA